MVKENRQQRQRRGVPLHEHADHEGSREPKKTRIRTQPPVDWKKEFGLEHYDLAPTEMMQLCEDVYAARIRQLRKSNAACAIFLIVKSNEALVAMRNDIDGVHSEALAAQNPREKK